MGYVWLLIAKFAGITKVVAMKQSGKICPGSYNSVRINSLRSAICLCVSVAICLFTGMKATAEYAWVWVLSGFANALNMFIYIICAERVGLVFVEAFALIGAVAIPLIAAPYLYRGESVRALQWIGCAVLFCAVAAFSVKNKKASRADAEEKKERLDVKTIGCLLLCMASNAGVCITQKLYVDRVGQSHVAYFNLMTFLIVFACFGAVLAAGKIACGKSPMPDSARSTKKLLVWISVAAVMMYAFQYTSTVAAGLLPSAVFYPLSQGIGMVLSAASDAVVFKQKITIGTVCGLILTVAGIVMINLRGV